MNFIDEKVDAYLYEMLPPSSPVLQEMERQAKERKIPIVGPAVARVLFQYAKLINAKTVFEMGSAIGYSTIWWAMAVGDGGRVYYSDGDEKNAREAEGYFRQAGVLDRIEIQVGDALELLAKRTEQFDIVFNDVDKVDYPRVFDMAASHVRRGGLFITDNVLWSGRVAKQESGEASTRAIREFNLKLKDSKEWFTTILPLRDGVAVATRL
ncbi:MAG TPA: O-methyltransferase [Candidatus Koribacter sp.]